MRCIARTTPISIASSRSSCCPRNWRAIQSGSAAYAIIRDLARDIASVREHLGELLASRRTRPTRRASGEASVAVMPVASLSSDPDQAMLADAMTDALITELTRRSGIHVISRASSMAYKGRISSLVDVAEELDVEWIVLASMVKAGGEIRITAQLVDTGCDENRWAESYSSRSRSVLTTQSEIAADVARSVAAIVISGREEGLSAAS